MINPRLHKIIYKKNIIGVEDFSIPTSSIVEKLEWGLGWILDRVVVGSQSERDYYSKNLSILNIASYSAVIETCFEMLTFSEHEMFMHDAIQTINPPIFLIVLKLDC